MSNTCEEEAGKRLPVVQYTCTCTYVYTCILVSGNWYVHTGKLQVSSTYCIHAHVSDVTTSIVAVYLYN